MASPYLHSFALFFSLLNPFLMSIYMLGIIRNSEAKVFNSALIQGSLISLVVFLVFAKTGQSFFNDVLHVRFESLPMKDLAKTLLVTSRGRTLTTLR